MKRGSFGARLIYWAWIHFLDVALITAWVLAILWVGLIVLTWGPG